MSTDTFDTTVADLESQIEAAKKKRLDEAKVRDEATKADRLKAELARIEQATKDDAVFADLVAQHGEGNLRRLNTRFGMVVVKAPHPLVMKRFTDMGYRADHPNPKVRTSFHDAAAEMVEKCRVYPDAATFDKIAEKMPALLGIAANEAYELGKPQVEEDAGK